MDFASWSDCFSTTEISPIMSYTLISHVIFMRFDIFVETPSCFIFVRISVRMCQSGLHWRDFHAVLHRVPTWKYLQGN
jgi:hypothetical protein